MTNADQLKQEIKKTDLNPNTGVIFQAKPATNPGWFGSLGRREAAAWHNRKPKIAGDGSG
ncbi:MAG: hypothetical protein U0946_05565 [Patescibacteria group bacterium]|nr:hypothetical protein [Patescibacteria group bacterium]